MKKSALILSIVILAFLSGCCDDNSTDPDDNTSGSGKIGSQTWMTKNLDVEHYRNGDSIPEVRDSAAWANLTTGAWCYYNNDPALGKIYGKLYNWYAVNDPRGLAPVGWHIPSDYEWDILASNLGGEKVAGNKLKEADTSHWKSPNNEATNESGFTALPGGDRYELGSFWDMKSVGYWWSASEYHTQDSTNAKNRILSFESAYFGGMGYPYGNRKRGMSVRCIKE